MLILIGADKALEKPNMLLWYKLSTGNRMELSTGNGMELPQPVKGHLGKPTANRHNE